MELRTMRYFIAVAEELHFGRAAERLHMAQPPLSQQIQKLEGELGVKLLERTKRKVALTPAGSLFLEEARLTLQQAERARRVADDAAKGIRGRLNIGFITSACYSVLPIVVRRFRHLHPYIDLVITEMTPSKQLELLASGELDVGLLRPPINNTCLRIKTFVKEPLMAAVPTGHRMASRKSLSLSSLSEEAFVLFPRRHGPGIYDVIMRACREAGFTPELSYEPNEMQTILAYVAAGLGISLVPASLSGFHPDQIVYIPLRGKAVNAELAFVSRPESHALTVEQFCSCCSDVGAEYASRNRKTH